MRRRLLVAALIGGAVVAAPAAPAYACHTYLHCVVCVVGGCEQRDPICFRSPDVELCV